MSNPLYNNFGNQSNPRADLIRQAKQFKNQFNGNPREEVQRLLNSGELSQADFNRYSQIAQQVMQFMGKM